ncbi:MAG: ROK family glucokinase [Lachnospiraceae bacterium]|nr:ROK family glucokinase [Lachnospiraceae bacterium]
MKKYCFGIDIGGTTVKCGLFETAGKLVDKWEITTRTRDGGKNILPDIAETIKAKAAEQGISMDEVAGVGVGVPGPVKNGKVPVAVNLHWGETDIEGELGALTGLPVKAGNDANVAALGEMWQGGAKGKRDVIVVTLGTGVGGGIIVDGKIVEGAHGAGGEIGHGHVDDTIEEPCNCGNKGCLEQVASATGIVRLAEEEMDKKADDEETLLDDKKLSSKNVFDAYKKGDDVAERIVNRFAAYLGKALGSYAAVIDPEVIVIGGGVSRAGDCLTEIVGRYYRQYAFPALKNTPIVLAQLGNDAGIYGSAKLVIDAVE